MGDVRLCFPRTNFQTSLLSCELHSRISHQNEHRLVPKRMIITYAKTREGGSLNEDTQVKRHTARD